MKPLVHSITALVFVSVVALAPASGQEQISTVQLVRLQNAAHMNFYTIDQAEVERITADRGWTLLGTVAWVMPRPAVGTTPLYRLAQNKDGKLEHFYTTKKDEANKAIMVFGYQDEGIAGYVAATQIPGTTPLFRLSSTMYGHFYTTNPDEASDVVKTFGYLAEGLEGFVWTGPASLAAVAPTAIVHKRIAGTKYFAFDPKDSKDNFAAQKGYMCVVHNPGCTWIFSVGNSGRDAFFSGGKPLPLGAKLYNYDFTPYWPKGLQSNYAGGIGRKGSYGSRVTSFPYPFAIGWENSCQGDYGAKNLYYTVSLIIEMPVGTDLGEETIDFDPAAPAPSCATSDYISKEIPTGTPTNTPTTMPPPQLSLIASYCFLNTVGTEPFNMTVTFKGTGPGQSTLPPQSQTMKFYPPTATECVEARIYGLKQGSWMITVTPDSVGRAATCPATVPGMIRLDVSQGQTQCIP